MRIRRSFGSSIPFALIVVTIMFTIAAALAVISTINLNMASSEENGQKALEVARAGINQFVFDVEHNNVLSTPPLQLRLSFLSDLSFFGGLVDNFPKVQPNVNLPYNMGDLNAHDIDGSVFITFNSASSFPVSTSNINGTTPITSAFDGTPVPAFSADIISTGQVEGTTRRLRALVIRKWNFAVAAAHNIFITGTPGSNTFPAQVQGDVYTLDGAITLGQDPSGNASQANKVQGNLATALRFDSDISIYNPDGVLPGDPLGNEANGQILGARVIQYPVIADVNPFNPDGTPAPGFTDLSTFTAANAVTNPAQAGVFLDPEPSTTTPGGTDFFLEYSAPPGGPPNALLNLTGSFFLNGNLKIRDTSQASGINLTNAILKIVNGSLIFNSPVVATKIFGEDSVLSVDNDILFTHGFFDGGNNGFVMKANTITTQTGGTFTGLIMVNSTLQMSSLPFNGSANPLPGGSRGGGSQPAGLIADTPVVPTSTIFQLIDPSILQFLNAPAPVGNTFPMQINGAILSPSPPPGSTASPPTLVLQSLSVTFNPAVLRILNSSAPLNISAYQEIP